AIIMVAGAVTNFFFFTRYAVQDKAFLDYTAEQALLSQSLAKNAALAAGSGVRDAFGEMATGRDRFDRTLGFILQGDAPRLPAATGNVRSEVELLQNVWSPVRDAVSTITNGRDSVLVSHQALATVRDAMPQLLAEFDEIAKTLAAANVSRSTLYHVTRQGLFGQRIARDVEVIVTGVGDDVPAAVNRFNGDV